eukprot:753437-Hanusia_phi.AAC.1
MLNRVSKDHGMMNDVGGWTCDRCHCRSRAGKLSISSLNPSRNLTFLYRTPRTHKRADLMPKVSNTFKSCKGLKTLQEKIRPSILAHFSSTIEVFLAVCKATRLDEKDRDCRRFVHTDTRRMCSKSSSEILHDFDYGGEDGGG